MNTQLLLNEYLGFIQLTKSKRTFENYSTILQEFSSFTPQSLINKMAEWRDAKLSNNTIVLKLAVVRAYLNWLGTKGVTEGISEMIAISKSVKHEDKLQQYVTQQQAKELIRNAKGTQKKLIIGLCYYCALRISECLSLNVEDVSEEYIIVRRTKTHVDRKIPLLTKEVQKLLQDYLVQYRPVDKLFPNVLQNSIQRYFKALCVSLGYPKLHLHSLRAGFCTQAFQQNIDPITIMTITGHKSLSNLQKYSHCTPEMMQRASKIFT